MKVGRPAKVAPGSRAAFRRLWRQQEKLEVMAIRYGFAGPSGPSMWATRHGLTKRPHGRPGVRV